MTDPSPLVSHSPVYHVGDLDRERETPRYSNEGRGLSVSIHPDAWRQIARGVAGETHELHNPEATFYEADPSGAREAAVDWCVSSGYVERATAWKGVWEDCATGESRYIVSFDEQTARTESQADVREDARVEETTALRLAARGRAYWNEAFTLDTDMAEPLHVRALVPVWYAQNALDVDGVWWPETYDPANHSAPRGVIFQERLADWEVVGE